MIERAIPGAGREATHERSGPAGALVVALLLAACDPEAEAARSQPPPSAAASSNDASPSTPPSGSVPSASGSAWLPTLRGSAPSSSASVAAAGSAVAPGPPGGSALVVGSAAAPASASPSTASSALAGPAPCPTEMALVGRTCVDRYEAHLLVPGAGETLVLHPFNERPPAGVRFVAASAAGQKPQGYISRVESEAACKAADKRLCTRNEWRAACRGKGGSRYPYGHTGTRGRCNSGKPHLLTVHFGDVRSIKYDEHFNSPLLNADPVGLAASGAYAECTNDVGTFDMVGNLHEWVAGMVDADFVYGLEEEKVERRDQPWQTGNGIFMGGFYSTTSEHGGGCEFTTFAHEPSYHDYSTGFRCCKSAAGAPVAKDRRSK